MKKAFYYHFLGKMFVINLILFDLTFWLSMQHQTLILFLRRQFFLLLRVSRLQTLWLNTSIYRNVNETTFFDICLLFLLNGQKILFYSERMTNISVKHAPLNYIRHIYYSNTAIIPKYIEFLKE